MQRIGRLVLAAVGIALVALSAPRPTGAADAIVLNVTPAFAPAPGFIRVTATVASSDDNRSLEIAADSQDFFRSSTVPLNGAAAPRRTVVTLQNLPPGEYQIRAVIEGTMGVRARSVKTVRILE